MKRELIITEDGSHTLYLPEMQEHYHSVHGALQESKHVFIEAGLKQQNRSTINLLEVGFGTGLNALLSLQHAHEFGQHIHYFGLEKYPLQAEEYQQLNYGRLLNEHSAYELQKMHECPWNEPVQLTEYFVLQKINNDIHGYNFAALPLFDLIYFDAFAPSKQEGIWTEAIFRTLYNHCKPGAILVTYCAKGSVRRDLQSVGFRMERIPGPPGKKEMLRGIK
ncbi:MAG: tRNA (5-methylaminomethyl-2-thiouridine)(34)-methyltransferase MnmD [Prolixibacteraceae bacterium]|nr:tRNA (5-methylaminomethyl-2-thiouridine)(34)-methyltransferase MnmD [Prolixibacteraceae bacterium]